MTSRFSVTKYVVYSKTLDLYWNPKNSGSLCYNVSDFSSLETATQFLTEQNAIDRALLMKRQFDTIVFPLKIEATLCTDEAVTTLPKKAHKALELVEELNKMSDEQEDSLTNEQMKKYRNAKAYLKEHNLL